MAKWTVDVYVRDPATGTYKITTFEKPESVQSVTALPDYFPTS